VDRIRTSMPGIDPKLLDAPEARMATLERMVNDLVISTAAKDLKLVTSDTRLANELQRNPSIAGLRGPDGRLDMDRYRQLAASQGMTPEMFEERMRVDLSSQQVMQGVLSTALGTTRQTELALNAYFQQREVQVGYWKSADYAGKVQVSDEALAAFYKSHPERFRSSESADIEYLVLDASALEKTVQLPEQDLKTYYEQNVQRLAGQEQRRASHILINAPKDAPAADREKARARAQELQQAASKSPAGFTDLARKNSQDPGSASKGGDLDFFSRGAMVKPFEDAAFAMKKGEISDVVESEFGFHIIALTDIKAAKVPSFEAMRPQLEADLRKQQAQRKMAELADSFSNGVYEQSDSLEPVAQKLKLSIQKASGITPVPEAGAKGVLNHPKLLQALFSEDAVQKRRNTEAIEVAPNTLVSARIVQHRPSAVRPFDEVKSEVRQQFVQQEAVKLAGEAARSRLAQWSAKPAEADPGKVQVVSRDKPLDLPAKVVDAALRADPAQLPAVSGVDLGDAGYAVVRVNKVLSRPAQTAQQLEQSRQQFSNLWAQAQAQAYLAALRSRYKVEMLTKTASASASSSEKP
jgi:peptidyl-prolyl cis-trans isomerase D